MLGLFLLEGPRLSVGQRGNNMGAGYPHKGRSTPPRGGVKCGVCGGAHPTPCSGEDMSESQSVKVAKPGPQVERTPSWYESKIEEPVRDIVRLLRDNGFNTECSCGHEMYIQVQHSLDGELQRLHHLVWTYLSERRYKESEGQENGKSSDVNFVIDLSHRVMDGKSYTFIDLRFPKYPLSYSCHPAGIVYNVVSCCLFEVGQASWEISLNHIDKGGLGTCVEFVVKRPERPDVVLLNMHRANDGRSGYPITILPGGEPVVCHNVGSLEEIARRVAQEWLEENHGR